MKKGFVFKLVAMVTMLCSVMTFCIGGIQIAVVADNSGNLITDGGFETGIEQWGLSNKGWSLSSVTKTDNPNGVYSGEKAASVPMAPVRPSTGYAFQTLNLQGNKTYLMSAAVKLKYSAASAPTAVIHAGIVQESFTKVNVAATLKANEWTRTNGLIYTTNDAQAWVGVAQWTSDAEFYMDDVYVGELRVNAAGVTGEGNTDMVTLPKAGAQKTVSLKAQILNQLNSTYGLEGDNQTVDKWELTEAVNGASINQTTGQLTITDDVPLGTLGIRITTSPVFNGAPTEPIVLDTSIRILPYDPIAATNLIKNGDFELGNTNNWSSNWQPGLQIASTNVCSGNYSALASGKTTTSDLFYQSVAISPQKTYLLSSMIKLKNKSDENASLLFEMYPGGTVVRPYRANESVSPSADIWKRVILTANTSTSTVNVGLLMSVTNWSKPSADYYVDELYAGELTPQILISAANGTKRLHIPQAGQANTELALSASVVNQFGTNHGLYDVTQTMDSWELAENYTGVSIQNGVLSVSPEAIACTVKVIAKKRITFLGSANEDTIGTYKVQLVPDDKIIYTDINGAVITDGNLPSGKVNAQIIFSNRTNEDMNITFYNAVFKKEGNSLKLVQVTKKDEFLNSWETLTYTENTLDTIANADDYILKSFVWSNQSPVFEVCGLN